MKTRVKKFPQLAAETVLSYNLDQNVRVIKLITGS
jgi:hypothetical protein